MKKWKVPLYQIYYDKEDFKSVKKVIERGSFWSIGPEITEFEKQLANYIGTNYAVSLNSGTSALHTAMITMNLEPKHEVMVPSFSFIATSNSILMVKAKPRFVDIEEETLGMDPNLIPKNYSKNTKAIVPIHYAGLPCKIQEIQDFARNKKISLIEDAAESLGATIKNKKVGTFGKLAIFSFAGNKIITTGEGGAVTTDSKKLFEKMKLIRSHGRLDKENYFSSIENPNYVELGYNWRLSSISAALATSQLLKIEKLIKLRRSHAKYLSSKLKKIRQIITPQEPVGYRHVYQMYSIRLPNEKLRNKLLKFLAKNRIQSKIFFNPIHSTKFYSTKENSKFNLKMTELISKQILTLPFYPGLEKENMNLIINTIKEFSEKVSLD